MKILETVPLNVLRTHEASLNPRPNVTLGSYRMPPAEQFTIHRVTLEDSDLDRLYLLFEMVQYTVGNSGILRGIVPTNDYKDRVDAKIAQKVDLRTQPHLAPMLVARSLTTPATAADGNLRLTAHYLANGGSVEGVNAFLCLHPLVNRWTNLPVAARL